ncbi:MAG: DMT family transporter [Alphaproteobacteria bacterium]
MTRPPASAGLPWRGIACMLVSSVGFGMAPSLARLAYDGGSEPLTAILVRFLTATAFVAVLMAVLRRPFGMRRRERFEAIGIGLVSGVMSYGYLAAVQHIPVSIAALVFFSFPALVAIASHLLALERLTAVRSIALVTAFVGIAGVVGVSHASLDPRGIALAFLAAVACAATIVWTSRLLPRAEVLAINLHAVATGSVVFLALVAIAGGPQWPSTALGWTGLLAAGLAYALGYVAIFLAIALLGPFLSAMLANLEPIIAVAFAVAVLGEPLGAGQAGGMALVFLAIALLRIGRRRR